MTRTEVQTAIELEANRSQPSLIIRARSPGPVRPPEPKDGSTTPIDMIELGPKSDTLSTKDTPVSEPPKASSYRAHIQFAACCCSLYLAGWNDGTTGPMLPRIQEVYNIGFAVVSLIFVFNCIGFVSAAVANVHLTDRFGFGTVMVMGAVAQVIGYALDSPAPPFPVLVLAYAINGFGLALQDAGANGYVASLKDNAETKMGVLHAVYGLGALTSPLVSTQFSQLPHWSFHFLVSMGIALINLVIQVVVFRFKTQAALLEDIGQQPEDHSAANTSGDNKYRQLFRMSRVHLLAIFIFIYVGVEVTIGGWSVTYVINERHGGPSSGYISSGFFGGLTLGRVALLWVNKKVGERTVMFVYIVLSIAFELVVWLVPSLIGGAVAVSIVGVLLGPIYPIVMNHSSRILPPWLLTESIGWIAGLGQAGSAFLPFLTGLLASREGIKTLQPLLVSMMGFMLFLWFLVPTHTRRVD